MNETPLPLVVWANDDRRAVVDFPGQIQRFGHFPDRVPIYFDDVPVAGLPFFCQRLQRHDFMHGAIQLHTVIVQDGGQVGKAVLGGGNGAFPDNPALALTIAQQNIGAIRLFFQPGSQRQPDPDRHPVTQQPAGHIHTGCLKPVGMTLVRAINSPQLSSSENAKKPRLARAE